MTQPIDEDIVLPPPPYTSPMLDQNQLLSVSWLTWFRQLYLRTGQAIAPSNTQILVNPMTTFGDMIFENGTPEIDRLAGNSTTTKKFLTQTGTGVASSNPGWNDILAGDVPTLNQNTTGTAGGLSVTLPINQGGTGQTTKSTAFDALSPLTTGGDLLYGGALGTGTRLANGSSGQVLKSNGTTTAPSWTTNIAGNAANVTGTVAIANGGTGQTTKAPAFDALSPMSASGDIIYGGAAGTGTRLAKGTNGDVLTLTAGLPSWAAASGGGMIGTDWSNSLTFTFNGFGTVSNTDFRWRRVGDSMEARITFTAGTMAASIAYIQIPTYTIDTAKMTSATNACLVSRPVALSAGGAVTPLDNSLFVGLYLFYDGSTNNQLFFSRESASSQFTKQNGNTFGANSEPYTFDFTIPISGWSWNA